MRAPTFHNTRGFITFDKTGEDLRSSPALSIVFRGSEAILFGGLRVLLLGRIFVYSVSATPERTHA